MRQLKISKQITGRETFSIEKYLQEISKIEVLTPEKEAQLANQVRNGDEKAREQLVLANLRFVVSVAKQYQNHGLMLGDLINEGNLGLLKAAECFDETKGFKFISYAVWWIRQSILQAIAEKSRLIRLPLNKISTINRMNRYYARLEQKYHREPTVSELAEVMETSESDVEENSKIAIRPISMEAPLGSDDDAPTLIELYTTEDSGFYSVNDMISQDSLKRDLLRSMSVLGNRETMIVSMFYGLNGYVAMSLEEIGLKLHLTSERVRQVKNKAIRKLKEAQSTVRLRMYL